MTRWPFLAALLCLPITSVLSAQPLSGPQPARVSLIDSLPVPFLENQGQLQDQRVRYYTRAIGGAVHVTGDGTLVYYLSARDAETHAAQRCTVSESLVRASVAEVRGETRSPATIHIFKGKSASAWRHDVPAFDSVSLGEVYRGVRLQLSAHGKNVEKIFRVAPSGEAAAIRVKVEGARGISVNDAGELEVETVLGVARFTRPVAYQEKDGQRTTVEAGYVVSGNEYGFKVGPYDTTRELVIDPLLASTLLGGGGDDAASAMAVDQAGNVYVTGRTMSPDFPVSEGAVSPGYNTSGNWDVFVSKFDPSLSRLLASTFLGGESSDEATAMAIHGEAVYVAGETESYDFPVTTDAYSTHHGDWWGADAFVAKLDLGLANLFGSTFLGGPAADGAKALAVNANGDVYVAGQTQSSLFPVTEGAYDGTYNGFGAWTNYVFSARVMVAVGCVNLIVHNYDHTRNVVFRDDGTVEIARNSFTTWEWMRLAYTGEVGFVAGTWYNVAVAVSGNSMDVFLDGRRILSAIDPNLPAFPGGGVGVQTMYDPVWEEPCCVYVDDLAVTNEHGTIWRDDFDDGEVSDWNLGTWGDPAGGGGWRPVAGDSGFMLLGQGNSWGNPYVALDFSSDGFVSKLDGNLTNLLASTFLGGVDRDQPYSVALDSAGHVYACGATESPDFPVADNGFLRAFNGDWMTYDVSFRMKRVGGGGVRVAVRESEQGRYLVAFPGDGVSVVKESPRGVFYPLTNAPVGLATGEWHEVRISTGERSVNVFVDGVKAAAASDCDRLVIGGVAFESVGDGSGEVFIDDVAVTNRQGVLWADTFAGGDFADWRIGSPEPGSAEPAGWEPALDGTNAVLRGRGDVWATPPWEYDARVDGFVVKFDADLTHLIGATFLGGDDDEEAQVVAVEGGGKVCVAGQTDSWGFPTTDGAFDRTFNGYSSAFVVECDADLAHLTASTFLGGSGGQGINALCVGRQGTICVAGETGSRDFPTTIDAYDRACDGPSDAFVARFAPGLTNLVAATFLGGANWDRATALALGTNDEVYVAGETTSWNFPAGNRFAGGDSEAFVSRFDASLSAPPVPRIAVVPASCNYGFVNLGSSVTQTFQVASTGNDTLRIGVVSLSGGDTNGFSIIYDDCSSRDFAPHSVATGTVVVVFAPSTLWGKAAVLTIQSNDPDHPSTVIPLYGTGSGAGFAEVAFQEGLRRLEAFSRLPHNSNDLLAADDRFATAVAADPNHYSACIHRALTRLAVLFYDADLNQMMSAFGIPEEGRDPWRWTAAMPELLPTDCPRSAQAMDLVTRKVLPAIDASLNDLAHIPAHWAGSVILSPDQLPIDNEVEADVGDVLVFQSGLEMLKATLSFLSAYDVDFDPNAVDHLDTPRATIAVNGDRADWAGIDPVLVDPEGDSAGWPDADIHRVYTAMDATNAYVMVETYGEPIHDDAVIEMNFNYQPGRQLDTGDRDDLRVRVGADTITAWTNTLAELMPYPISGARVVRGQVLEVGIPLSQIGNPRYFSATFVNIRSSESSRGDDPSVIKPTIKGFLRQYPALGTVTNAAYLAASSNALARAIDFYLAGSESIRAETDWQGDDFLVFAPEDLPQEAIWRLRLQKIRAALGGPVRVDETGFHELVDLRRLFEEQGFFRAFLPQFGDDDSVVRGTFPDPTFGDLLPDMTQDKATWWLDGESVYRYPVVYVSPSGSNVFPYADWATAATTIQGGLEASGDGTLVRVADGHYVLDQEIAVEHGVTLRSEHGAGATIVDGNQATRCFNLGHSNAVVEGFTITGGYVTDSPGGGVCGGVLRNCAIIGNSAGWGGGVIDSRLYNCTLTGNRADYYGGGVVDSALFNCIVYYNDAPGDSDCDYWSALSYCCTPEPGSGGEGNIDDEPLLASASRLSADSPCIGRGNTNFASGVDLDGDAWGRPPSMGCDEWVPGTATGTVSVSIRAAGTNAVTGEEVRFIAVIEGRATASDWSFGDGTAASNRPYVAHAWTNPGLYAVVLRVRNASYPQGVTASVEMRVVPPPTYYVDAASTNPVAPYASWETAAATIQDAIDAADTPGALVLVTNGVYATGGRATPPSTLRSRIVVTKPILVRSVNGPTNTLIVGRGPAGAGAVRCAYLAPEAVLEGFTLSNGCTRTSESGSSLDVCGGGAYGGRLRNCVLKGNTARFGGGAYDGTLSGCTLEGNLAFSGGGGAYGGALDHCVLNENTANEYGGGTAYGALSNCVIRRNHGGGSGGGSCGGTLSDCSLEGNFANSGGGAQGGTLSNCRLFDNTATCGGGVFEATLFDCTLSRNWADWYGGGAYAATLSGCIVEGNAACYGGGAYEAALSQCTVTGNSANDGWGGTMGGELKNSIVYYNTAPVTPDCDSYSLVHYCCVSDPATGGEGNITDEPRLASASHLSAGSPCIGRGDSRYSMGTDIDGDAWGNPPSMGCDEFVAATATGDLMVSIEASCTNVVTETDIRFVGRIEGRPTASVWSFGDGVVLSNCPYVTYAWTNAGTYAVVLRACNASHPEGVEATVSVRVVPPPVCYVDAGSTNPVSPYESWDTAATTIQEAIDAVTLPGTIVLVTNGVYATGGRTPPGVSLPSRIVATGLITVKSVNGPEVTTIVGQGPDGASAMRCAYVDDGAIVSGFTLSNGHTRTSGDWYLDQSGGGVYGGILRNCRLIGNSAGYCGGGASSAMLSDCTLSRNSANSGGGAYGGTLNNCTLSNNTANYGGGIYSGTLTACDLAGNTATSCGGGAYYGVLDRCMLSGNTANYGGGAYGGTLTACSLTANRAVYYGGGLYSAMMYYGTLSRNTATYSGGGVYGGTLYNCALNANSAQSGGGARSAMLFNCALAANVASSQGGGAYQGTLVNCSVYGNTNGGAIYAEARNTIAFQNIGFDFAYMSAATACFTNDPCFVDAEAGQFQLRSNSPCINLGINGFAATNEVSTDLAGNPRISGGRIDVGAYEYPLTNLPAVSVSANPPNGGTVSSEWEYPVGSTLWIMARAAPGWTFTGWSDGSLVATRTMTVPAGGAAYVANFSPKSSNLVYYVDAGDGNDGNNGLGEGRAKRTLQEAVDAASSGDTILVSAGTYSGEGRVPPGQGVCRAVVVIDKPLTLKSVNGPSNTLIVGRGPVGETAIRCVWMTSQCVLEGFTLTNGATASQSDSMDESGGGGAWCADTTAVLSNCVVDGNAAYTAGGGVLRGTLKQCAVIGNSVQSYGGGTYDAVLLSCLLSNNSAEYGGGVYVGTVSDSTLRENSATYGGASAEASVSNSVLSGNSAYYGGGAYEGELRGCVISANRAAYGGGAYEGVGYACALEDNEASYYGGGAYNSTLSGCRLVGNTALYYGGGACYGTLTSSTLNGNTASYYGGGVAWATLHNCTVTANTAGEAGGGACGSSLANSIVYYNSAPVGANVDSCDLAYCCTTPDAGSDHGVTAEPKLADGGHLAAGSPCIGAGSADYTTEVDLDGQAWRTPPSIGCDEYYAGPVTGALSVAVSASYTNFAVGFRSVFSAYIEGHATSHVWTWSDGTTLSNRLVASRSWAAPGDYTVALTAYNTDHPAGVTASVPVHVVPGDRAPIALNVPTNGSIDSLSGPMGDYDEWTFFGRAGRAVTIEVCSGWSGSMPEPPYLDWVEVELADAYGNVLRVATNTYGGEVVAMTDVVLAADGLYRIFVRTPEGRAACAGNYAVTVWDTTPTVAPLQIGQKVTGHNNTPYSVECWTFSAVAGQQIRFNLLNSSAAGLVFSLAGPSDWTGFMDLTTSSDLVTLPFTGAYTLIAHGTGGLYGGAFTFALQQTSQTNLAVNTTFTGTLAGSGQAELFELSVTERLPLSIRLVNSGAGNRVEIYAKFGAPPTRGDYDYKFESLNPGDLRILVPEAAVGQWYILVYGDYVPSPGDYTLSTTAAVVLLSGCSPRMGGTAADTPLTITGAGFVSGATVQLVASNGSTYAAAQVSVSDAVKLTAMFPAGSVPAGMYTVRITQPGGVVAELVNAFEMLAGGLPHLTTKVIVPGVMGYHMPATIYVEYANEGRAPMPAPLLTVTATQKGESRAFLTLDSKLAANGFWTASEQSGFTHTVQILGSGAVPGWLAPGESYRIPVYYAGWQQPWDFSYPPIAFSVASHTADSAVPLDWGGYATNACPPGVSGSQWVALLDRLARRFGTTWGSYVTALNGAVGLASPVSGRAYDAGELFHVLVEQMLGVGSCRLTGLVVDTTNGQAVPNVQVIAWQQGSVGENVVRAAYADPSGQFSFTNLPAGTFQLFVEGYQPVGPAAYTLIDRSPVEGVVVDVSPLPPPEVDTNAPHVNDSSAALAVDAGGVPHLVWQRGSAIWHAYHDGARWIATGGLPGATGSDPRIVAGSNLVEGAGAGVMVAWQTLTTNGSVQSFCIATNTAIESNVWQTSSPRLLTDQETSPRDLDNQELLLVMMPNGQILAVWQKNRSTVDDDTDLYYRSLTVEPGILEWPARSVAFGASVPSRVRAAEGCRGFNWSISKFAVPGWVPILGGSYGVGAGGEACRETTDCALSKSVAGSVDLDTPLLPFAGELAGAARYRTDPKLCAYILDTAEASGQIGTTVDIPAYAWKFGPAAGFTIHAGLGSRWGLAAGYAATWKGANFPYWPPETGSGSVKINIGVYGVGFLVLPTGQSVKVKLAGTGGLDATLHRATPATINNVTVDLSAEGKLGRLGVSWKHKWTVYGAAGLNSLAADLPLGGDESDLTLTINPVVGTTNVYGGSPVLANVSANTVVDGPPAATDIPGNQVLLAWTLDSDSPSNWVGSRVMAARSQAGGWTTPVEVPGSRGFNSDVKAVCDASGHPLLVWSMAGSDGMSVTNAAAEVMAAMGSNDVVYSIDDGSGWSMPVRVAELPGNDQGVAVGRTADGGVIAAWVTRFEGRDTLRAATWDGSGWSAASTVATGQITGQLCCGLVGGQTTLFWTEDFNEDAAAEAQLGLACSYLDGGSGDWSSPQRFTAGDEFAAAVSPKADAAGIVVRPADAETPPAECCQEPPPPPEPPQPPGGGTGVVTEVVGSQDPNDKLGPGGVGAGNYITGDRLLPYRIDFENATNATAPAQVVEVTDVLSTNFDWNTFELTEIGFGEVVIAIPAGTSYYEDIVPMSYGGVDFEVWISVGLDFVSGRVCADFYSIDPVTLLPPDVTVGFLPPEDGTGRGMGHVSYTIRVKAGLPSGTQIRNVASIVFDQGAIITTDQIDVFDPAAGVDPSKQCLLTIDAAAPTSSVLALPVTTASNRFTVSWWGTDDPGGSGIGAYDIYARRDDGPFLLWLPGVTNTSALYEGEPGVRYGFYSVAHDRVGYAEVAPSGAQAETLTEFRMKHVSYLSGVPNIVVVDWESATNKYYDLWRSTNLSQGFTVPVATNLPATPPMNVFSNPLSTGGPVFLRIQSKP